jgi:hypothetical protein
MTKGDLMAKDDHKGYRERFEKAGKVLRDVITESVCPECGTKGLYRRVWRKGDRKGVTLYAMVGECPKGHKIERYGYGEAPVESVSKALIIPGVK